MQPNNTPTNRDLQQSSAPHKSPGKDSSEAIRRFWHRRLGKAVAAITATGALIGALQAIAGVPASVIHLLQGSPQTLTVAASVAPGDFCDGIGAGWVFPNRPPPPPAPGDGASLQTWAHRYGGIPASGNVVTLDIQTRADGVIINGIRIVIRHRKNAPAGLIPVLSGGCGGVAPSTFLGNLDRNPVVIKAVSGTNQLGQQLPPVPLPHAVSPSTPEVWHLRAITATCDCEWVAYLNWVVNGQPHSTLITDGGAPFRTAATGRSQSYSFPS